MSVIENTRRQLELSPKAKPARAALSATIDDFEMQEQCHSNWCWAAVTASIAAHYDKNGAARQCEIANVELGRRDCCRHRCHAEHVAFNVSNVLGSSLNRVRCLDRMARNTRAEPSEILAELQAEKPVCARVVWPDGRAHFVVIVGYVPPESEGSGTLIIEDPFWGSSEYSYDRFCKHYQLTGGRWNDTYYTQPPDDADPVASVA